MISVLNEVFPQDTFSNFTLAPTDMRVQLAVSVFESNKLLREEFLDGAEFEVRRFSEQVFLSDELFVEIVQGCGFCQRQKNTVTAVTFWTIFVSPPKHNRVFLEGIA